MQWWTVGGLSLVVINMIALYRRSLKENILPGSRPCEPQLHERLGRGACINRPAGPPRGVNCYQRHHLRRWAGSRCQFALDAQNGADTSFQVPRDPSHPSFGC